MFPVLEAPGVTDLPYGVILDSRRPLPGSRSTGTASNGRLFDAVALPLDGEYVLVLPSHHFREANFATEELAELLLRQTTTFGVRWRREQRLTLAREVRTVDTEFGPIQVKLGYFPGTGELIRLAPEYDSCRRAADESGRPFAEVYNAAHQAAADGCRDGARD